MGKIKKWIHSAAGIISLVLLVISILMLIFACSSWGNLSEKAAYNTNTILFGIATNFIGLVVTVSFVQYFIDRQNNKQEKEIEKATILRFDRIMKILIQNYIVYFNTIVTPMGQRNTIDKSVLKQDFELSDMKDMYYQSLLLRDKSYQPAIIEFYDAELEIRQYCMNFIQQANFKYHQHIRTYLEGFIKSSLAYNVRGAIIGNINLQLTEKKYIDIIREYLSDSTKDWVSIVHSEDGVGCMMAPYVCLFEMLKIQRDLLNSYMVAIKQL